MDNTINEGESDRQKFITYNEKLVLQDSTFGRTVKRWENARFY